MVFITDPSTQSKIENKISYQLFILNTTKMKVIIYTSNEYGNSKHAVNYQGTKSRIGKDKGSISYF